MSALQALKANDPDQNLTALKLQLNELSKKAAVVLQWIPAHRGIKGNEKADMLAKEGSKKEQKRDRLSFREARTLIRNRWSNQLKDSYSGYKPHQDPLHLLGRAEQTIIFRLRTGHCRLRSHLRKMGAAESAACDCGEGDQTPEHVLQACPLLAHLRTET